MTFLQIYTEVVNLRFNGNATKLAQVKNWVNQAEIAVWNAADWVFKRQPLTNLTITNGTATEPADFGKAIDVYNALMDKLAYLPPSDFEQQYLAQIPVPTGPGEAFTVINRQILTGPKESGTYQMSYRRRYAHLNGIATVTAGVMTADTDTPLWDSEFHYILVPWAIRLGKLLEDDPSASLDDQVLLGLSDIGMFKAMKDELVEGVQDEFAVWSC